ncbi:hypothetical protein BJ322DRAFT_304951 [Thelephora terrestris]|uniref:Decapping nuclease n=1 Tax=Thelephora terrestris TaxID=56493 RepID=A0A9P6L2Y9_9AGAM|nr:hypothetical protein BJ322DRAFT_304951 [Thelephora terrestris]
MSSSHRLGNFATPLPFDMKTIGAPKQIAYFSHFPGRTHEYCHQSRSALKLYSPPTTPFQLLVAPPDRDRAHWSDQRSQLDSLPRPGLQSIIDACQLAGRTADLAKADVITNRGTLVDLAMGKIGEYGVYFVDGKLHILRKFLELRWDSERDCFERACTRPMTERPHGVFSSVVRRKIGNYDVIMAGEVDCTDKKPSMKDYIELATHEVPEQWYKRNPSVITSNPDCVVLYPKWYLKSYLLGIPTVRIGYRTCDDAVFNIVRKPVKHFLPEVQIHAPMFDPAVDMGRLHDILSALSAYFRALGPSVPDNTGFVLKVDVNGNAKVTLRETCQTQRPDYR